MSALIVAGNLERATGACRGLLKDQNDLLSLQVFLFSAGIFGAFEVTGKIEEVVEFPLCKILNRQQRPIAQIEAHANLRWNGVEDQ